MLSYITYLQYTILLTYKHHLLQTTLPTYNKPYAKQDEILCFRISETRRKRRASCCRYIYALRKPVIPTLGDSIKFPSCVRNVNVKSCFRHI